MNTINTAVKKNNGRSKGNKRPHPNDKKPSNPFPGFGK